jgi:ketosteroid isomerase-like protein
MEATNRLFSEQVVTNKQLAKLDSVYTEDAAILPPDAPIIRGRENIKQFWSTVIQEGGLISAPLTTVEADVVSESAYEVGTALLTFQHQSGTSQISVKYIVVWKQDIDGSWKWHRDIWNPSPREGAAVEEPAIQRAGG